LSRLGPATHSAEPAPAGPVRPPRRVLIISSFGRSLVEMRSGLIQALQAAGLYVTIAAPAEDPDAPAALAALGVDFRPLDLDRGGINPVRDVAYAVRIARCLRATRPDIVLAIAVKPVIYTGLVARLFPRIAVCSMISGLGYVFSGRRPRQRILALAARILYRVALRRSRVVFFQNGDDLDQFVAWGLLRHRERGAVTNGDGVDLDQFAVRPLPGRGRFLLIGRLLTDKGIPEYAAAARIVRTTHPEAAFRLVGWFDEANPHAIARAAVDAWTADGTIEFLGFQADVRPVIEDTDVYVLPSHREGLSRTTCEAMAMGRPIVTTDAPGCRQTVEEGVNGFLVPVGDSAGLAAALRRFLDDPALAAPFGAASRRLAEDRFDMRVVNPRIVERMLGGMPMAATGEPAR
jgi:glycosyltransferase involved in cell wall biosynthesis